MKLIVAALFDEFSGFDDLSGPLGLAIVFAVVIITTQVLWFVFLRRRAKKKVKTTHELLENGMMECPECSQPTEVEYRFCQHCAADTGRQGGGPSESDESNESDMI